jgi:hypothetical protein
MQLFRFGLCLLAACSARNVENAASDAGSAGSSAADPTQAGPAANTAGLGANSNPVPIVNAKPSADMCGASMPFKVVGCGCQVGESSACWMGSPAKRNSGGCHDGVQHCIGTGEFPSWGPCEGQELDCGDPPPPTTNCACVPGAVIECDEDCSVSVFCSLTAQKTCQPDGTWSPCRETGANPATVVFADGGLNALLSSLTGDGGLISTLGSVLGDAGVISPVTPPVFTIDGKCRSLYHGCATGVFPGEQFAGDCSTAFVCGHAPIAPQ